MQERPNEEVDLGQRGVVPIIIPDFGIGRDIKICRKTLIAFGRGVSVGLLTPSTPVPTIFAEWGYPSQVDE